MPFNDYKEIIRQMIVYFQNKSLFIVNDFVITDSLPLPVCTHLDSLKSHKIYLVTRDPYTRLEEYYQSAQEALLPRIGFMELIHSLEFGLAAPPAQTDIITFWEHVYAVKLKCIPVKVESTLATLFPGMTKQETTHRFKWTREMRRVVNKYYAKDFMLLGYSMLK